MAVATRPTEQDAVLRDLQNKVARLQRFDSQGAKMQDHQMIQALIQSNQLLAAKLEMLTDKELYGLEEDPTVAYYQKETEQQKLTASLRRLWHIKRLTLAQQQDAGVCPCGKHHGIMFVEGNTVLEENVCPEDWWHMMDHLAFYEERTEAFSNAYPYKEFLHAYRLK